MKISHAFIFFTVLFFLCQGCASTSSGSWQQRNAKLVDTGNGICQQSNGLMWQAGRSKNFSSFDQAQDYVHNLSLGGYSDWRLPLKGELFELCWIFDLKLASDCPSKQEGNYWSKNGKEQVGNWEAYPMCGGSDYQYLKSKKGRVRAVRP